MCILFLALLVSNTVKISLYFSQYLTLTNKMKHPILTRICQMAGNTHLLYIESTHRKNTIYIYTYKTLNKNLESNNFAVSLN